MNGLRRRRGDGGWTPQGFADLLDALDLPEDARRELAQLRPENYIGLATRLARLSD